jgi:hypothetical protein
LQFFKYLHPDRPDVLENLKIRYTQAFALNDPFESFPGIVQESKEWYWEKFTEIIYQEIEKFGIQSPSKRKQYFRVRKKEFGNFYYCYTDEKWLFEQAQSVALMDSAVQGYLSLSTTNSNILMWSHYAHNHRGYVLGFKRDHSYFDYATIKIKYSDNRPWINPVQSEQDASLFYTKSTDWAYEQEFRKSMAFVEAVQLENGNGLLPFPDKTPDPTDPALTEVKLFDFPADSIKSVILGWKSHQDLENKIREALKKHRMEYVEIFKAVPHKFKYEMEILPFNKT